MLLPFLSSALTELDGRLDGRADVAIDPVAKTFKPQGTLTFKGGVVEVTAMGSELHDVTAKLTATPGVVRLDDLSGRGLTGRFQAAASARFDGMAFAGARGVLQVPSREPMPLVVDGVQAGLYTGRIDVSADPIAGGGLDVKVTAPGRMQLPEDASHDVQALGEMPGVRFGSSGKTPADFVAVAVDTTETHASASARPPTRVTVDLGSGVQIKQGATLDVLVEGSITILVGDDLHATGQLRA